MPTMLPARAIASISRRDVFRIGAASAALVGTPLAARGFGAGFTHGVASGEPGPERVMLWTRYVAEADIALEFQVAEDAGFTRVVAEGSALAKPESDWCAKSWADGLRAGTWYFYRFVAPDGTMSDIGRTRTLPEGEVEKMRIAMFSCSNMGFGWFNAYAHAAESNDFDLALHLGDYFYEYEPGTYPSKNQTVPGRMIWPDHEAVHLADYRLRYATYRADPDLRRIHQVLPMISVWDDHESANDSWEGGAQNHQPDTEGPWSERKAAAMRAYREWLPVSDEPWASYEIGNLATLFRLETRLTARAEQFSINSILRSASSPEQAAQALTAFRNGDYLDPSREMLGAAQQQWLADGFNRSKSAGKTWQVLVQQVLMGNLASPPELVNGLSDNVPDYVRERVLAAAMSSRAGLPSNMDSWDGYPAARARLFEAALAADANFVSLAGDTHNAWAFDLAHDGAKVGVEFGGHSVTSPGLENSLRDFAPDTLARALVGHNDGLKWANTGKRGYVALELTPQAMSAEYRFLDTVTKRSTALSGTHRAETRAGSRTLAAT